MSISESSELPPWVAVEEEVAKEYRDILSTLPREKGWAEPFDYLYEGFWHPTYQFPNSIQCQRNFQAQDTDIIVSSSPKCGTTWLKALTFAIANRKTYPPTDKQHPLQAKNPHQLVPFLELDIDFDNLGQEQVSSSTSPRLLASHLPYVTLPKSVKDSACKNIYICRNPKAAFISLWHFMNKLRPQQFGTLSLEEAFDKFCRGVSLYGPIWDHVLQYWKASLERPEKILFLKYEEMREQPSFHIQRMAEFMGFPFSEEEEASGVAVEIAKLCGFDNLSNVEVNKNGIDSSGMEFKTLFRKGKIDDWKNYLTPEMVDRIDRITAEKFLPFGLEV